MRAVMAKGKLILFPVFLRSHWLAGIMYTDSGVDCLDLFDSAPSPMVERDITRKFSTLWPGLDIEYCHCQRQARGSEDCGIFTLASIFSVVLRVKVINAETLPGRMRPFLADWAKAPTDHKLYLKNIKTILLDKSLIGGADDEVSSPPTNNSIDNNTNNEEEETSRPLDNWTRAELKRIFNVYSSHRQLFQRNCARRSVFVALALLSVAERTKRSLTVESLASHASKTHLPARTPMDVVDILYLNGVTCIPCKGISNNTASILVPGHHETLTSTYCFVYKADQRASYPLPVDIRTEECPVKFFVCGAKYVHAGTTDVPHYELTTAIEEASLGLYLPTEHVPPTGPKPRRHLGNGSFLRLTPTRESESESGGVGDVEDDTHPQQPEEPLDEEQASDLQHSRRPTSADPDEEEEEHDPSDNAGDFLRRENKSRADKRMLLKRQGGRFDRKGRTLWGTVCPRHWVIHPIESPHIHSVAWRGISEAERGLHQRWLRRIRDMPADLLDLKPEDALLEMVNRDAVANRYSWTTYVRKLSLIQSALKNLPLYTDQPAEVDLNRSSVWRSACQFARKMMKQSDTHPAQPLSKDQFEEVMKVLRSRSPTTALYLMLMWCTAARAVDIERLKVKDVAITSVATRMPVAEVDVDFRRAAEELSTEVTYITVQMKRGKGAHFRGPYTVFTAIPRNEASILSQMLATRRPSVRLFPDIAQRRTEALVELRKVDTRTSVPSIRRGAIRFLAAQGLTQEELMKVTGHKRLETLLRYLGDGRQRTTEEEQRQERVARALHRHRTVPD